MSWSRNGRILRAALAVSIAVHMVIASFVHLHPVEATETEATPVIIHIWVHPKPTPTPQTHPQIARRPNSAVRSRLRPPHVQPNPNAVTGAPLVQPTGEFYAPGNTGTPEPGGATSQPEGPMTSPKPACSAPDVEAKTLVAISPDQPDGTQQFAGDVTAQIKVDLDASGRVTGVSVYQSTGSLELDRAALQAARESSYAPELRDCRAVSGSYLFKVEFTQ